MYVSDWMTGGLTANWLADCDDGEFLKIEQRLNDLVDVV